MSQSIKFNLDFLTPGMNGPDGLMRGHFTAAKKLKQHISLLLRQQKPVGFKTINHKVSVTYIRYTSHLMDWDNACASFKHIGDALQIAGVISDDSPDIIARFTPVQIKCKMKERRTEIVIEF